MYKYKTTTDVEIGDLVIWTNPSSTSRIANKPYRVISTDNTLVGIKDENNNTSYYGSISRKTLQTKPASEAVVGDYMYRITSGPVQFPQNTVIKITELYSDSLEYADGFGVDFDEVIVIAQAEPEVKYPYFTESKQKGREYICKVLAEDSYTYVLNWGQDKQYNSIFYSSPPSETPCDFTIQPDIDDIDWWQSRFEAGLPVYAIDSNGTVFLCKNIQPNQWYRGITFSMTDPSLVQQVPTIPESAISFALYPSGAPSEPTQPTTKEQSMNKTTLKLLLELLGKDATNSKFVGIITNEDESVGYMYFDSKEDATECMAQPKMELHKLHLFEKSCVLAQKPRKVIEV